MSLIDRMLGPTIISGREKSYTYSLPGTNLYVTAGEENLYELTVTVPAKIIKRGNNNLTVIDNPNEVPVTLLMVNGRNNLTELIAGSDEANKRGTRITISRSKDSMVNVYTQPHIPVEVTLYKCNDVRVNILVEGDTDITDVDRAYPIKKRFIKGGIENGNSIDIFTQPKSA